MNIRGIDNLQNRLEEAESIAEKIRIELDLHLPMTQEELNLKIRDRLGGLGFTIFCTNKLHNYRDYGHLPSVTIFNHPHDRSQGGRIYIYDRYSVKKKRELLFHEFIHIADTLTPDYSTDSDDLYNGYMLSKDNLKKTELKTNLISLALMVPFEQFGKELFDSSYNIEDIVASYSLIETSTILEWIVMHDYFNSHYANLFITKNKSGQEVEFEIEEYCQNDNNFSIRNIILNENSITYKSKAAREPLSGESNIENKPYHCFVFYERDILQPLPSYASPVEQIATVDRLTVIGWPKDMYNFIQKLRIG
jgi:hypothetical protein